MAFFKFRAHGQKNDDQPPSPAETIDDMRRRARHRLIGATVLVAAGVLGFPLLFDTQPRPVQVDIPIEIPDRDKPRPAGAGSSGKVGAAVSEPAAATSKPASAERVAANASLDAKEEVVTDKSARPTPVAKDEKPAPPTRPAVESKTERKPESKPESRPEPKPDLKAEAKAAADAKAAHAAQEAAKARALLDGKSAAADAQGRFVVQIGAFADADKAQEARTKLERAGLKTYTQVVETKDGKRIRVRIGPYAERTEADKVAGRIKSLNLPASILSL